MGIHDVLLVFTNGKMLSWDVDVYEFEINNNECSKSLPNQKTKVRRDFGSITTKRIRRSYPKDMCRIIEAGMSSKVATPV